MSTSLPDSGIPSQDQIPKITPSFEEQEEARRELEDFGMEPHLENLDAVVAQRKTLQHPQGFEDILDALEESEILKELMEQKGIHSIVHSEGKTVWDHVRTAIEEIEQMPIPDERKRDLKFILLYHDLGKSVSGRQEKNKEQTQKRLEKGELHQAMIGHPKERLADVEAGFRANGVDGRKLAMFLTVVENHMNTSLIEQDPRKTVRMFETFGETDDERREVVELLVLVLQVDGNATEHIELTDGELRYSKNEKKLKLDFQSVWNKYEEGKRLLEQEEAKRRKQEEEAAREQSVFGMKLSEYLATVRGIEPGPGMGKAVGKIKGIMASHKETPPDELRQIVDDTSL